MVWAVLIAMALILDSCLLFAGSEMRSHVLLASAASASTAAALVMVAMLNFPFEGGLALSGDDFAKSNSASRLAGFCCVILSVPGS